MTRRKIIGLIAAGERRFARPGVSGFHAASLTVLLCLCCLSISSHPQVEEEKWQRLFTGEEFLVDVNPATLSFGPDHILRAKFRTVFSKAEPIGANSEAKYKTRVEIIEFKSNERRYRIDEVSLFDTSGKLVKSWENSSEDWKILKEGGIMERQLIAARGLAPLGHWKVIAYRYGEGGPAPRDEPAELAKLKGISVALKVDAATVGTKNCPAPAYQSRRLPDKDFSRDLGTSLDSIGVKTNYVDAIYVKCEGSGWKPPQSLLIRLPENSMLMLWDGVFLVLKKQSH